jgi:hypothetical protein
MTRGTFDDDGGDLVFDLYRALVAVVYADSFDERKYARTKAMQMIERVEQERGWFGEIS